MMMITFHHWNFGHPGHCEMLKRLFVSQSRGVIWGEIVEIAYYSR